MPLAFRGHAAAIAPQRRSSPSSGGGFAGMHEADRAGLGALRRMAKAKIERAERHALDDSAPGTNLASLLPTPGAAMPRPTQDPRKQEFKQPYPEQHQEPPGVESEMDPKP